MSKLLDSSGLREPLGALLARRPSGARHVRGVDPARRARCVDGRPDQRSFGAIDVTVRRNGYGRQRDSFEAALDVDGLAGGRSPACSSARRASSRAGPAVEVLATHDDVPVLMRSDDVWVVELPPGALRRSPNPSTVRQRGDQR